jgi:hypothetical protein
LPFALTSTPCALRFANAKWPFVFGSAFLQADKLCFWVHFATKTAIASKTTTTSHQVRRPGFSVFDLFSAAWCV